MSVFKLGSKGLLDLARSSGIGSVEELPVPEGTYVRWAVGGGLDVWIRLGPSREPTGHAIHFAGPARFRMELLERQPDERGDVLAGVFRGRSADGPDFAFASPDFRRHDDLALPAELDIQLATLVATVDVVAVEPASRPFLPGASPQPSGPFDPGAVTLTGRLLRGATQLDPTGGGSFTWLLVGTPGGAVDVVIPGVVDVPDPGRDRLLRARGCLTGLIQRPGPAASLPRARARIGPRNRHDRAAG